MNKKFRILAATLSLALCVGALTACNSNSGNNSGNSSNGADNSVTDNSTAGGDGSESTLSINTVAEVTAVKEDGSLELKIYSGSGNIADFAAVDFSAYTATEETEELTIDDVSVLFTAVDGTLSAAQLSDIAVGDMLVISQDIDTDALLQVVRYAADTANTGDSGDDTTGDTGETTGSDTAEDTAA